MIDPSFPDVSVLVPQHYSERRPIYPVNPTYPVNPIYPVNQDEIMVKPCKDEDSLFRWRRRLTIGRRGSRLLTLCRLLLRLMMPHRAARRGAQQRMMPRHMPGDTADRRARRTPRRLGGRRAKPNQNNRRHRDFCHNQILRSSNAHSAQDRGRLHPSRDVSTRRTAAVSVASSSIEIVNAGVR